ncbi:MAG: hypothetical protein C4321_04240, partial [Chloroflexota bacterium]
MQYRDEIIAFDASQGISSYPYTNPNFQNVYNIPGTAYSDILAYLQQKVTEEAPYLDDPTYVFCCGGYPIRIPSASVLASANQPDPANSQMAITAASGTTAQALCNGNPALGSNDLNVGGRMLRFASSFLTDHPTVSGVYMDTADIRFYLQDFSREHFQAAVLPLSYDPTTLKPVIYSGFSSYEYLAQVNRQFRISGRTVMTNMSLGTSPFLVNYVDVPASEFHTRQELQWLWDYRRALACQKPVPLTLQLVDYVQDVALMHGFMRRCIAYGMFPSFSTGRVVGSNPVEYQVYWKTPELYERDRVYFQRYLPAAKRLHAVGW